MVLKKEELLDSILNVKGRPRLQSLKEKSPNGSLLIRKEEISLGEVKLLDLKLDMTESFDRQLRIIWSRIRLTKEAESYLTKKLSEEIKN